MHVSRQTLLRLNKISKIEDYFIKEVRERELMSKKISKYIAAFDCFDNVLIVLSATSRGVSIASFASVIGSPVERASVSYSFTFSLTAEIKKKLLKTTQNEKNKHNMTAMLARSELNSIETLTSKALIDCKISHQE